MLYALTEDAVSSKITSATIKPAKPKHNLEIRETKIFYNSRELLQHANRSRRKLIFDFLYNFINHCGELTENYRIEHTKKREIVFIDDKTNDVVFSSTAWLPVKTLNICVKYLEKLKSRMLTEKQNEYYY